MQYYTIISRRILRYHISCHCTVGWELAGMSPSLTGVGMSVLSVCYLCYHVVSISPLLKLHVYIYIYHISCHSMRAPILYLAEVLWMCRMNSPTKLCIQFAPLVPLRFRHWSLLHPASARRHLRRLGLRGVTTIEIQDSTPKPKMPSECHDQNVIVMNGPMATHLHTYCHMSIYVYYCMYLDLLMQTC